MIGHTHGQRLINARKTKAEEPSIPGLVVSVKLPSVTGGPTEDAEESVRRELTHPRKLL